MISVIVPVYNGEKYLRRCLDSLVGQNDGDVEVIVVDDGSTDSTAEIVRSYPSVRYVFQKNAGQAAARNTGIDHATGSYIAFCDADDAYAPGALGRLRQALETFGGCDIASAAFCESADEPEAWPVPGPFACYDAEEALRRILYQDGGFHCSVWAKLFRRHLFDEIRFVPGLYYEDLEITPRLYAGCRKTAVTPSPLYFYRKNPLSFINTWHPRRLHALDVTESIVAFAAGRFPALLPAARSRRFSAYFNMFVEGVRHGDEDLAGRCYAMIKSERAAILADPRVRFKNKAGALASCFGKAFLRLLARQRSRVRLTGQ